MEQIPQVPGIQPVGLGSLLLAPHGPRVGRFGQVWLTARSLKFLDHEAPARGRFQREGGFLALEPGEPRTQILTRGGADLAGLDLAGVYLYIVEGDLLPMHVESAYNLHCGASSSSVTDINAVMISLSALELRRSLFMPSFLEPRGDHVRLGPHRVFWQGEEVGLPSPVAGRGSVLPVS